MAGEILHDSPWPVLLPTGDSKAEAVEATKGIQPRKSRSAGGQEPQGSAHLSCDVTHASLLTGLHPSIGHTQGQGLVLWALQQSLWGPWLGPERAFLFGEGNLLILQGARGAGDHVPCHGAGLGGALRAMVGAAANVHDAGDIDLGPVATWGRL